MTDAWISENGIEEMQNHWFLTRRHNRIKISADTIATPEHCMLSGINYKEISPYMDIELMDAYMNRNGEYRYLSLDYSLFGGDIHGGIDTVVLYETDLGTGSQIYRSRNNRDFRKYHYLAGFVSSEMV